MRITSVAPVVQAREHGVGGGIQPGYGRAAGGLRRKGARDVFPELHAPLVEAVDVPDDTLHEYLVLVQREQLSQSVRVDRLEHEGGGWPVAVEAPVRLGCILAGHQRGRL